MNFMDKIFAEYGFGKNLAMHPHYGTFSPQDPLVSMHQSYSPQSLGFPEPTPNTDVTKSALKQSMPPPKQGPVDPSVFGKRAQEIAGVDNSVPNLWEGFKAGLGIPNNFDAGGSNSSFNTANDAYNAANGQYGYPPAFSADKPYPKISPNGIGASAGQSIGNAVINSHFTKPTPTPAGNGMPPGWSIATDRNGLQVGGGMIQTGPHSYANLNAIVGLPKGVPIVGTGTINAAGNAYNPILPGSPEEEDDDEK